MWRVVIERTRASKDKPILSVKQGESEDSTEIDLSQWLSVEDPLKESVPVASSSTDPPSTAPLALSHFHENIHEDVICDPAVHGSLNDKNESRTTHIVYDERDENSIAVKTGNPSVSQIHGVIHLYRERSAEPAKRLYAPSETGAVVAVLSYPLEMPLSEFLTFLGPLASRIYSLRVLYHECKDTTIPDAIKYPNDSNYSSQESNCATDLVSRHTTNDDVCHSLILLLRFRCTLDAEQFYCDKNGEPFHLLGREICHVVFVRTLSVITEYAKYDPADIQTAGLVQAAKGEVEMPVCAVCLERLDPQVSGLLTTLCNHTFHCQCFERWTMNTSCPLCRYEAHVEKEKQEISLQCIVCGARDDLWMCLLCGHVGCGRYHGAHARKHFESEKHAFSMEVMTRRVWDYEGDRYVHRLVRADGEDGKVMYISAGSHARSPARAIANQNPHEVLENSIADPDASALLPPVSESLSSATTHHSPPPRRVHWSTDDEEDGPKRSDADELKKPSDLAIEFTCMLTSQLEIQRTYWEQQVQLLNEDWEMKFSAQRAEFTRIQRRVDIEHSLVEKLRRDLQQEKAESKLTEESRNQWVERAHALEIMLKKEKEDSLVKIADLQEQLRDTLAHIAMTDQVNHSEFREEMQNGTAYVSPEKPVSNRGRRRTSRGRN